MSPVTPAPDGYPIKLVRDHTADIVNPSGEPGQLFYRPLPEGTDIGPWLRNKLDEEVREYQQDRGLEELTQVLSVVEALAEYHGVTLPYLLGMSHEDPRGGFRRGVMMYGYHPEYDGA